MVIESPTIDIWSEAYWEQESVIWKSLERAFQTQKQQVQRPSGGTSLVYLRNRKRPIWLEPRDDVWIVEDEVRGIDNWFLGFVILFILSQQNKFKNITSLN